MNQQFARQAVQALTTAAAQQQEAAGQHVGTPDIRLTVAAETISGDRLTLIMTAAEQQHEAANAEVAGAGLGWQLARHEQFHGVYSIAHMPHLWLACLTIPARYVSILQQCYAAQYVRTAFVLFAATAKCHAFCSLRPLFHPGCNNICLASADSAFSFPVVPPCCRQTDKEAAGDLHYCVGVFNRPVVAAQWYDVATEIYEGALALSSSASSCWLDSAFQRCLAG